MDGWMDGWKANLACGGRGRSLCLVLPEPEGKGSIHKLGTEKAPAYEEG